MVCVCEMKREGNILIYYAIIYGRVRMGFQFKMSLKIKFD